VVTLRPLSRQFTNGIRISGTRAPGFARFGELLRLGAALRYDNPLVLFAGFLIGIELFTICALLASHGAMYWPGVTPGSSVSVPVASPVEAARLTLGPWTGALAVAAFAIALMQLLAFVWQALYMRRTVGELRNANLTARMANDTSERALLSADRPWLGLERVAFPRPVVNEPYRVDVVVRNSGRAPALKLHGDFVGYVQVGDEPIPELMSLPDSFERHDVIMPNGVAVYRPFRGQPAPTEMTIKGIADGTVRLWVVGILDYEDSGGRPHSTRTRLLYEPRANVFAAAPDGNDAN
jgi:hypothetical protein